MNSIRQVLIYGASGCYADQVGKLKTLFYDLNHRRWLKWRVTHIDGSCLAKELSVNPKETLLVIPAGPSSKLEESFVQEGTIEAICEFIKEKGGRIFATCGASYAFSLAREYNRSIRFSKVPLFEGTAHGPISIQSLEAEAVRVSNGKEEYSLFLSGGGTLRPLQRENVEVLAKYVPQELNQRVRARQDWENAAILCGVGAGSMILTMPHLEYGANDIGPELETNFPKTNWFELKNNLSSDLERLDFTASLLSNLEEENGFYQTST
jgi:glutamine amidotransferase-like uncharacterized protein